LDRQKRVRDRGLSRGALERMEGRRIFLFPFWFLRIQGQFS